MASTAKNSRKACLAFSFRPFITLRSSQSRLRAMTPSRLPAFSARFFAPVAAMPAMFSLSMKPAKVAQAANSGLRPPSSCSSTPRARRSWITCWLCSSEKKAWISWATSRPTSGR
ncbi:hypothetical protein D9M71_648500 [compost metagenome]